MLRVTRLDAAILTNTYERFRVFGSGLRVDLYAKSRVRPAPCRSKTAKLRECLTSLADNLLACVVGWVRQLLRNPNVSMGDP